MATALELIAQAETPEDARRLIPEVAEAIERITDPEEKVLARREAEMLHRFATCDLPEEVG